MCLQLTCSIYLLHHGIAKPGTNPLIEGIKQNLIRGVDKCGILYFSQAAAIRFHPQHMAFLSKRYCFPKGGIFHFVKSLFNQEADQGDRQRYLQQNHVSQLTSLRKESPTVSDHVQKSNWEQLNKHN